MAVPHLDRLLAIPYFGQRFWSYHHAARDRIVATQLGRLGRLVRHAFANNAFYRERFAAAGMRPNHLRTPEDLRRLPVVRRRELKDGYGRLLSRGYRQNRLIKWTTSGSSGTPFTFIKDRKTQAIIGGFYRLFNRLWNVDTSLLSGRSQLTILVTHEGGQTRSAQRLFMSQSYYLDALWPAPHLAAEFLRLRPIYLVTYPSVAKDIARECARSGVDLSFLTHIKTGGEHLDRETLAYLKRVFPRVQVFDTYSSNDAVFMGYQCREGSGLHIPEYHLIVEILDEDGQTLPPGALGEIVITDLTNYSMPLIPYGGLGDLGRISPTPCSCGSALRVFSEIAGRIGTYLTMPDGRRVHAFQLTTAFESVAGIFRYQIVQERRDLVRLCVIPDREADWSRIAAELQARGATVFPTDMQLVIELAADIERPPGYRKAPVVLCKLTGDSASGAGA